MKAYFFERQLTTLQARRIKKKFWVAESLSKNVGQLGQLTKKIVQLKSLKMPRNT